MVKYYPEWRNQNAYRRYPFGDLTTLTSQSGYQIADHWLLDACFSIRTGPAPVHLASITVLDNEATIEFADADQQVFGTVVTNRGTVGTVAVRDQFGDWIGTLVLGPEGNHPLFQSGDGVFEFEPVDTELVLSAVFQQSSERSVTVLQDPYGKQFQDSRLVLVGENGVQLQVLDADEYQPDGTVGPVTVMRLHITGDPQSLARLCQDSSRRPGRFIRQIVFQSGDKTHVCAPDQHGNILMVAATPDTLESALQVNSVDNKIEVRLAGKRIS
jgi:hypothetical protein